MKKIFTVFLAILMAAAPLAYASVTVKDNGEVVGEAVYLDFKGGLTATLNGTTVDISPPTSQSFLQGIGTLSGGAVAVTFVETFIAIPAVFLQDTTAANAMYPTVVTRTGFTANGTSSDTFNWMAIGAF